MQRIQIIDDDRWIREVIQAVLGQDGYDVVLVSDGRSGLATIERGAIDLVIIDIFMPGLDGIETIKLIKKISPLVPIVAMSGFMFRNSSAPAPDFLRMATQLGASYSLHKPFRAHELRAAVEAGLFHSARVAGDIATGDATGRT
jgi:CheY-like chemotaxis protein